MKTISRTRHVKNNHSIGHEVEKIIKKAMLATAVLGVKRRAQNYLTKYFKNAKHRSDVFHRGIGRYTHKKPYRSLGLAMITGAVIGAVMSHTLKKD